MSDKNLQNYPMRRFEMWEEWGWRAPTDQAERIPLLKFSKMSYAWVDLWYKQTSRQS